METKKGIELSTGEQRYVLSAYVHRFTRDNKPQWANKEWKDGKPYPVQFASDKDWLAHTDFVVTKTGKVHRGLNVDCSSHPTWPDNPELRKPLQVKDKIEGNFLHPMKKD